MQIPFAIEAGPGSTGESLVFVRCTEEQAAALARILRAQYPAARPRLIPVLDRQQYSHCCRLPDSESGFRQKWPAIQFQMLLASTPAPSASSPTSRDKRATGDGAAHEPGPDTLPGSGATTQPAPVPTTPVEGQAMRIGPSDLVAASAASRAVERRLTLSQPPRKPAQPPAAPGGQRDPRIGRIDELLAGGKLDAVVQQIPEDDPSPDLRGRLGVALARRGETAKAGPHLIYAWKEERTPDVALELARIYWQHGDYDAAVAPYEILLDTPGERLEGRDYAAIAELAGSGAFGELTEERQLTAIETYYRQTTALERGELGDEGLARRGLELARAVGRQDQVRHAYQHLLDVLIQRRSGQGIVALLDQARDDYWQQRLSGRDRFDLLDEVGGYLTDYPLLREPLMQGYEELLQQEIDTVRHTGAFPDYTRDLYRALRGFARRSETCEAYKKALSESRAGGQDAAADSETETTARLVGKRIALVGGHERTREHVRERLHRWGARVDEVAPPTNGRIGEREIVDKVRSSDLILLIVGYMGHDMSTVVNNLLRRQVLTGKVLPVDCRGTSGICREILLWAAQT